MPFPAIEYCIVCEQVRLEAQKKLTILGFYGVAPHVDILAPDLTKPTTLFFIFGLSASACEEVFPLHYSILDPDGSLFMSTQPQEVKTETTGKGVIGFVYVGAFGKVGSYAITINLGDNELFRTRINVHSE